MKSTGEEGNAEENNEAENDEEINDEDLQNDEGRIGFLIISLKFILM